MKDKNLDLENFDYSDFKASAIERIKSGEPLMGKGGVG